MKYTVAAGLLCLSLTAPLHAESMNDSLGSLLGNIATATSRAQAVTTTTKSSAESTNDSLGSLLGNIATTTSNAQAATTTTKSSANSMADTAISALDMIPLLTGSLGSSKKQAEGGLGSLFGYAKGNLSSDQFSQLATALPGMNSLLGAAPAVKTPATQQGGLGSLLNTAAQFSSSLQPANTLMQQFESLGLKPEMVGQYAQVAQQYLQTPLGQEALQLLTQGFSGL